MVRSLDETAAGLGAGRPGLAPAVRPARHRGSTRWPRTCFRPVVHVPDAPAAAGRGSACGRCSRPPWSPAAGRPTRRARCSPASRRTPFHPLHAPTTAAVGLMLTAAGHAYGWPVAEGGSRAIADALAALLRRARRHDRDRASGCARSTSCPRPTSSCSTSPRAPPPTSAATGCPPGCAAPTGASATARARSRSTSPSRAACRGPTRRAAAPAPSTSAARSRRSPRRAGGRPRAGCRSARSSSSASSTSPIRGRSARRRPPGLGVRPRARTATPATPREADPRPDRAVRAGLPGAHRGHSRALDRPSWPHYNPNYVGGDIATGANTPLQLVLRPRSRSTRTAPASPASTSARPPPRRAPACTACAATTRRGRRCGSSPGDIAPGKEAHMGASADPLAQLADAPAPPRRVHRGARRGHREGNRGPRPRRAAAQPAACQHHREHRRRTAHPEQRHRPADRGRTSVGHLLRPPARPARRPHVGAPARLPPGRVALPGTGAQRSREAARPGHLARGHHGGGDHPRRTSTGSANRSPAPTRRNANAG